MDVEKVIGFTLGIVIGLFLVLLTGLTIWVWQIILS